VQWNVTEGTLPFFEEPEATKARKGRRRLRRDEYGRPTLVLPRYLAEDAVLAVSDEAAVLMHGIACYPSGFAFELEVIKRYEVRPDEDEEDLEPFGLWARRPQHAARFGVQYSDGRRATLDQHSFPGRRGRADAPIAIVSGGGSGGGGHYSSELWVQPLPPAGPVIFAVEWTEAGIEETLHTIEGELFREAAKGAKRVFQPRRSKQRR
jgi:hypothetical protein